MGIKLSGCKETGIDWHVLCLHLSNQIKSFIRPQVYNIHTSSLGSGANNDYIQTFALMDHINGGEVYT